MKRWGKLSEQYGEEYKARGVVAETARHVEREIERFGSWLNRRRPKPKIEDVCAEVITAYLKNRGAFKAKSTLAGVIGALRGFGTFLVRERVWRENPLRWMRGPRIDSRHRLPKRIGTQQMQDLWESAAGRGSPFRRTLWTAMIGVLYGAGVRCGEMLRLDLDDWSREEGLLYVDGCKTRRERRVAVPELVWRCIEAYLPHRYNLLEKQGRLDERALFINKDGVRAKSKTVGCSLKRLGKRCGLDITFHQFRHTCATDLLENGARMREVQELLGHQSLATTMWYNHVANPALREAIARHPINTMLNGGRES